ncbi:glycoside hydrolase family 65 protein [Dysgonomonas sp. GY617]|uniref:glycoside hydrolase family 65 protein n=1 Tax=Dysgonomonas sp. GY617 TaxID=2780420 RepID=UPI0018837390|nr:glycoside hydrolase family 65 protein [Dysgonomonas sp. GY617]MBF0576300.1 glycoside hydrolase family 65 protein [Dysgonomonas sp. GY617]
MKHKCTLLLFIILISVFTLKAQNPWIISANQSEFSNYYGVTVANGMIGIISSPEPLKVKEVVLAGVYDIYNRGRVSNFLPNYNLLNLNLSINGDYLHSGNVSNFRQELNMKEGSFSGSFDYKNIATVTYSYYALRNLPHCVLLDVNIKAKSGIKIDAENVLETPSSLRDQQNYYHEIDRPHLYIPLLTSIADSPSKNIKVAVSNTFLFEEAPLSEPKIYHKVEDSNKHSAKFAKEIKTGEQYSFSVVGTLLSSVQTPDPFNQAERMTIYAKLEGKERLLNRHQKAWDKLWEGDIQIDGDPQAQQDIRSMLYHLYSFTRENTDLSPSPMGLSGLGYNGHIFWDTEIFMYPPLLLLHPKIAKSMIEYRYRRLDAARQQAAIYGYAGAMFPWESAASGAEECPVWALSGTFEHHITADVGIAAWQYYLVTQDIEWLKEKGWPILKATAEFWASRVELNNKGQYEIKNVVAADEWAENVDNNAYTNGAAIKNLQYATECAAVLGVAAPKEWSKIADNIPIFTMENGVTREHDTYTDQKIKQADVNLLAYPLGIVTDENQIIKDLKFYETKVPDRDTPAMTQAIFALLYSRTGDGATAYHWFKDAYLPNLNPPFRVMAEYKGGTNPYFATGAGGLLQAVMMGFGGLDINPQGGIRQLRTAMPPHWKKVTITGVGLDKKTYIQVNDKK